MDRYGAEVGGYNGGYELRSRNVKNNKHIKSIKSLKYQC